MFDSWWRNWLQYIKLKGWLGRHQQNKTRMELALWKAMYRKTKYTTIRNVARVADIPYNVAEEHVEAQINKHPVGRKRNKLAMEKD